MTEMVLEELSYTVGYVRVGGKHKIQENKGELLE